MASPRRTLLIVPVTTAVSAAPLGSTWADTTLLNVSYDPTREFYSEFSEAFAEADAVTLAPQSDSGQGGVLDQIYTARQ